MPVPLRCQLHRHNLRHLTNSNHRPIACAECAFDGAGRPCPRFGARDRPPPRPKRSVRPWRGLAWLPDSVVVVVVADSRVPKPRTSETRWIASVALSTSVITIAFAIAFMGPRIHSNNDF